MEQKKSDHALEASGTKPMYMYIVHMYSYVYRFRHFGLTQWSKKEKGKKILTYPVS